MQHNLHIDACATAQRTHIGGLAVRTGIRGGVCVDVNDQVKTALQTVTNALGGTATTAATPATTSAPVTTSS
jgi:hypothetical protein